MYLFLSDAKTCTYGDEQFVLSRDRDINSRVLEYHLNPFPFRRAVSDRLIPRFILCGMTFSVPGSTPNPSGFSTGPYRIKN